MDRAEYLDLLASFDDTIDWEWPGGWDRQACDAAERKFLLMAEDIQQALGEKCTIEHGTFIQDASFHAELLVPEICKLEDYVVSLRVSNFGNLATLYDADDVVKPGCADKIKDTLKRHGYIYIPSWVLREPYADAKNVGIPNWAVRYFDWL